VGKAVKKVAALWNETSSKKVKKYISQQKVVTIKSEDIGLWDSKSSLNKLE